ncbi:hypothetical protein Dxin01_02056 [Deinococcus xinjiangensis]|uniref:Secreted protein n=1 Tax=Deinococcus xinjiangensis TaxID=457454 RepID=A0ABP9VF24_9DEIO
MFCKLAALLALTSAFALAGGGASPTPFGSTILPADTKTWRCESGRKVVSFSPNTQSVRLFYRQQGHVLMVLPPTSQEKAVSTWRYSEIGLPTDRTYNQPRVGEGLEWVINTQKPRNAALFAVQQDKNGKRHLHPLEFCHQI